MDGRDIKRIRSLFESICQLAFDQMREETTAEIDVEDTVELIREDLDSIEVILRNPGKKED